MQDPPRNRAGQHRSAVDRFPRPHHRPCVDGSAQVPRSGVLRLRAAPGRFGWDHSPPDEAPVV